MLRLDESQWEAMQTLDSRHFVAAVCDQFLANRPEMLEAPGRDVVLARMQAAYEYAQRIGFTSTPPIVQLLYLSADAPDIVRDPEITAYLRKPGLTPEQRWDDLMAVINYKQKGNR